MGRGTAGTTYITRGWWKTKHANQLVSRTHATWHSGNQGPQVHRQLQGCCVPACRCSQEEQQHAPLLLLLVLLRGCHAALAPVGTWSLLCGRRAGQQRRSSGGGWRRPCARRRRPLGPMPPLRPPVLPCCWLVGGWAEVPRPWKRQGRCTGSGGGGDGPTALPKQMQ